MSSLVHNGLCELPAPAAIEELYTCVAKIPAFQQRNSSSLIPLLALDRIGHATPDAHRETAANGPSAKCDVRPTTLGSSID